MTTAATEFDLTFDARNQRPPVARRLAVGSVIAVGHIAIISFLAAQQFEGRQLDRVAEPMVAELAVATTRESPFENSVAVPVVHSIDLAIPDLQQPSFAESAALDAPKIDPEAPIDITAYTERAALPLGTVATVILLLEISPDGSVMSAEVVRSNSGDAANAAALDYARATRWMPGTIAGEPRAMQASLTVILGERS